jgi:dephospho-CoA kinase
VAGWLVELGAVAVDADALAREAVEQGEPALDRVAERFGPGVLDSDGRLDRAALGRIVFADALALADLEAIVHPAVRPRIEAAVAAAERAGAPAVVIEAIKLVEAGYAAECDEVWLVTCTPAEQRERLLARGTPPEDAARRIAAQAGLANRLAAAATRVLDTTGNAADVRARVAFALEEALARARDAGAAGGRGRRSGSG